jgi:hypothetical protein
VIDGGPCQCAAGCDSQDFPRLCHVEDLPSELPSAVVELAATEFALYMQSDEPTEVLRYDLAAGTTSTAAPVTGPMAAAFWPDGGGGDVFFVVTASGESTTLQGYDGGGAPVQAVLEPGLVPAQITAAYGRVVLYAVQDGGLPSKYVFLRESNAGILNGNFVSGGAEGVLMATNADGIWWAPNPQELEPHQVLTTTYNGGPSAVDLAPGAGQVRAIAAADPAVYLTGPCGDNVSICRLDVVGGAVSLAPILTGADAATVLHADGAVLYWTETDNNGSTSYRCEADHCAESRLDLGTGSIAAFARNAAYVYVVLANGPARRIQRKP